MSQFIGSLKPLQTAQMPHELSPQEWALIIGAFWEAVARMSPTPFDPTEQPGDWVLLKTPGVTTMHRVLAGCLPIVIQRGARLSDVHQYEWSTRSMEPNSGAPLRVPLNKPAATALTVRADQDVQSAGSHTDHRAGQRHRLSRYTGSARMWPVYCVGSPERHRMLGTEGTSAASLEGSSGTPAPFRGWLIDISQ
ncbi:hypothetical protein ACWDWU_17205 [Streptomyces sp. NPDC003442]